MGTIGKENPNQVKTQQNYLITPLAWDTNIW